MLGQRRAERLLEKRKLSRHSGHSNRAKNWRDLVSGPIEKGSVLEESLRAFFLRSGYYVLRGVRFRYASFDATDVDLWLYARTSAVLRHRTIVDAKNKTTPKAIERIFWTRGLQEVLGVDQAIVANRSPRQSHLIRPKARDCRTRGKVHITRSKGAHTQRSAL
jgi:hypothetical protein